MPEEAARSLSKYLSIKVKNYNCFGEEPQGFDLIKPMNIIIGRNNSGKSSLLDLIEYIFSTTYPGINIQQIQRSVGDYQGRRYEFPEVFLTRLIDEHTIRKIFKDSVSNGDLTISLDDFCKRLIGGSVHFVIKNNNQKIVAINPPLEISNPGKYEHELIQNYKVPIFGWFFNRLKSDRDVIPELPRSEYKIEPNGNGATNIIYSFLTKTSLPGIDGLPSDIIKNELLVELNKITEPDALFTDISIKQIDSSNASRWEIFLEEKEKGSIALSKSGSGLKTILLVLIFVLIIPKLQHASLSQEVYAFEELENNLHPALQRKLFSYLREIALNKRAYFFITTHSNVIIDLFSSDIDSQICHVAFNNGKSLVKLVTTYLEKSGVLNDLDIRASDLLQSNGIIWVEGPSDRIYVNKFINLWSNGKIREGLDYQCIFYGGSILSHLSADVEVEQQNDLVKILLTNRNAIILMDSDKDSEDTELVQYKLRMKKEIEDANGICWITYGRTIENYIPPVALNLLYEDKLARELNRYEHYQIYLEDVLPFHQTKFYKNKVIFAERILPFLNKNNLFDIHDLNDRMLAIVSQIQQWNKI